MYARRIFALVTPALLSCPFFALPARSQPLNAKCLLQIDDTTYLDDRCHFDIGRDADFFSDLRIQLVCPDGRNANISPSCAGAEQQVSQPGVFGYLVRQSPGAASLCWNEGDLRRAIPCFEGLTRDGACWGNPRAAVRYNPPQTRNVKFCAWAL